MKKLLRYGAYSVLLCLFLVFLSIEVVQSIHSEGRQEVANETTKREKGSQKLNKTTQNKHNTDYHGVQSSEVTQQKQQRDPETKEDRNTEENIQEESENVALNVPTIIIEEVEEPTIIAAEEDITGEEVEEEEETEDPPMTPAESTSEVVVERDETKSSDERTGLPVDTTVEETSGTLMEEPSSTNSKDDASAAEDRPSQHIAWKAKQEAQLRREVGVSTVYRTPLVVFFVTGCLCSIRLLLGPVMRIIGDSKLNSFTSKRLFELFSNKKSQEKLIRSLRNASFQVAQTKRQTVPKKSKNLSSDWNQSQLMKNFRAIVWSSFPGIVKRFFSRVSRTASQLSPSKGLSRPKVKRKESLFEAEPVLRRFNARKETDLESIAISSSVTKQPRPTMIVTEKNYKPIITADLIYLLLPHLPRERKLDNWKLVFSAGLHGYNLETAYDKCRNQPEGSFFLVVKDTKGYVFGAFGSQLPTRIGRGYFGNGMTFLVALQPSFKVYKWTRTNSQFIVADANYLAFGGDSFGLFLDFTFESCFSRHSNTFHNKQLASSEAFKCVEVELWTFQSPFK